MKDSKHRNTVNFLDSFLRNNSMKLEHPRSGLLVHKDKTLGVFSGAAVAKDYINGS